MKVKSLFAATLGLALGLSALTGVAFAGQPDDPGKSEEAPGQVIKAEEAPAAAPAAASAKEDKADTQASAKQEVLASGPGVKPSNSTDKWTTCETGGGQGTSATCSRTDSGTGTGSDEADASKQYGNGETSAQIANGRGAPAGTVLTGPGNSQPHKVAVCPRKPNKSGGVDVHAVKTYDTSACQQLEVTRLGGEVLQQPPTVTVAAAPLPPQAGEAAEQKPQGGVLGAQAAVRQPPAQQGQGGVLGEIAAVPSSELPFTGIQLWFALLAGIGLLAAGLGARKAMR